MKRIHVLLSTFILCLPVLCVWIRLNYIPLRIPLHFDNIEKPVRTVSRQEWFSILLSVMFVLTLVRSGVLAFLSKQVDEGSTRFIRVYLLSAAFVSSILTLFILKTIYQTSDYLPILLTLFGAAGVYLTAPTDVPIVDKKSKEMPKRQQEQANEDLYRLARFVFIRVNLLAAVLMVFVNNEDRWTIGIAANLLALATLMVIKTLRRSAN